MSVHQYKTILLEGKLVTLEEAVFRSEKAFRPANLKEHLDFWENEILKDHPFKNKLMGWLTGVRIEEFLLSFTTGQFQGIPLNSYYPEAQQFENYVPPEFEEFMDITVKDWVQLGMLLKWEDVRKSGDPYIPVVVSPLGVEPKKPRALWDGRYVNEFCRDTPFVMDNAARVAEVAWSDLYFFKIDHKNGYQHVPIHEASRKYFGVFWKGVFYVFAVLPFGWKCSPIVYHTLTDALAMYCRSLGIPMLVWIDDMLGMTEHKYRGCSDEDQFQSALRAMVVLSIVLFKAGYFLGLLKCCLLPEKIMIYLGIECDSLRSRFTVPNERVLKYLPLLYGLISKQEVTFFEMEQIVGKLVSLECAVPAGMWYTREQYAAMKATGVHPDASKRLKQGTRIVVSSQLLEEWEMWLYFLKTNKGAPWKNLHNIFIQADISSDASGRSFAGVVSQEGALDRVVAGEFWGPMLTQDIQVKEGEALRQTLLMMVMEMPHQIKGKTLVCKVDNQSLKAILEKKGSTKMLPLNAIGKQIYWMQQQGEFFLQLEYVKSEMNVSDKFTRQCPSLEASLAHASFLKVYRKLGPFHWDLMATTANVNRNPEGVPLLFFSRYYDQFSQGVNLFSQKLGTLEGLFCFPPVPLISMVLKFLHSQKVACVVLVPDINASWVNMLRAYTVSSIQVSKPYDAETFSISHATGKLVPKRYEHAMIAVKLRFD